MGLSRLRLAGWSTAEASNPCLGRWRLELLGCAGWAPGQLEGEISAGGWLPTSVRPNLVLDASVASAWDEAYHETVGADPAAFSNQRGRA